MTSIDRFNGLSSSVAIKTPCIVATTANITLSGTQTIDGIAVVADDRVLVKNQTNGVDNGVYDVSATAWTRSLDFDGARDAATGSMIMITSGTLYAATVWSISTANPITIGTTSLAFVRNFDLSVVSTYMQTLLAASTSAQARSTLGVIGTADANFYKGSFTRDLSLASSSLAITGVGFTPRSIFLFGSVNNSAQWFIGTASSSAGGCIYSNSNGTGGSANIGVNTSNLFTIQTGASDAASGALSSMDTDGFTIAFTKSGSPSGTATINYMAIR